MSISPRYVGQKLGSGAHTIELFLDYVCPFSKKAFATLQQLQPILDKEHPGQFQFVFRHQIQPWHPASLLVHEAGLAVSKLAPEKFWDFSAALFDESRDYYDEAVWNETRGQTYERLADLAHRSVGVDKKAFLDLVTVAPSDPPRNAGNKLTNDVKAFIRFSRQNGVHVSPSVAYNGILDPDFSSSSTVQNWLEKLQALQEAVNK